MLYERYILWKKKTISLRLTNELYNLLQFKAASKISASDYIRQSITQSDIKVNNSKDIFALIGSVNKVGNNINQIAHTLNIANKNNNLNDIDYNNIIDSLLLIEYQLKDIIKNIEW